MFIVFKSIRIVPYGRHNEYLWKGVNRPCKDFFKTLLACAEIWGTTDYIEFTGGWVSGVTWAETAIRTIDIDMFDMFGQSDKIWWWYVMVLCHKLNEIENMIC